MSWHTGFRTRPPKYKPVAVIDIGSNSVRVVVYDGLRRSPTPIFNEKVLCGLGKGVALSGRLNASAVIRAISALKRFRALIKQMGVGRIFAVATAAAREAKNGPSFISAAEKALGHKIQILTGKQEALYAALGVMAGFPEADGIAGDLGGGSLELIDIKNGVVKGGVTLPIGPLRLIDLSGGDITKAQTIVDEYLSKTPVLKKLLQRNFYAVGGAWRALARLHMAKENYPLHVLHNYQLAQDQAANLSTVLGYEDKANTDLPKGRVETLPYAAMILERLMHYGQAKNVTISVYGVREGLLFARLPKKKGVQDALLSSCWDFARRYARSPSHELELCDWTDQLFGKTGFTETANEKRLRYAACLLADIGWRAHPDYRAERSLGMIAQAAFAGIDHRGRVFLALTVFYRYDGEEMRGEMTQLMTPSDLRRAHLLSSLFRLAYILSAAMPRLLPKIGLKVVGKSLVLRLPGKLKDLMGERVQKRLDALAEELGLTAKVLLK